MPFAESRFAIGQVGTLPDEAAVEAPEFFRDVIPAAFRRENIVASFLASERAAEPGVQVPEFDAFDEIEGYEANARAFVDADSPQEVARIKSQIDREREDERTLDAAGAGGVAASMAAGLLDPVILLPVGGVAAKGLQLSRGILKGGLATARAGLIGSTVSEAALQSVQETRTLGESALNVTAATFLSGVLGSAASAFSRKARLAAEAAVEKDLDPRVLGGMDPHDVRITGADLAADTGPNPTAATSEKLKGALGLEKTPLRKISPMLRTATSESIETRRVVQELADTPLFYEKNALGIKSPVSVESRVIEKTAALGQFVEDLDQAYVKYRTSKAGGRVKRATIQIQDAVTKKDIRTLSFKEFKEEIGRAARIGDVHPIPEVEQMAKLARKNIFDPLKDDAIAVKLLPEGVEVETATSYLTRMWNPKKIKAQRNVLQVRTRNWLQSRHPDLAEDEVSDIADQIIDRLLSRPDGRLAYESVGLAGKSPFKQRTFLIEDDVIEDFLESDIEFIARAYVRTMTPDIEIKRTFGSVDMEDQLKAIRDDYKVKIRDAATDAERTRLDKQRTSDLRDINAMREILRGTYGAAADPDAIPTRIFRGIRQANLLSRGGGFTVAAIPDLGRTVMIHGLGRTLRDGLLPMIANFRGFRVAAKEAQLAGTAWDMKLDTTALSRADLGDEFGRGTAFERGIKSATRNFMLINLLSPWNTAAKQVAGMITQARILDATAAMRTGRIKLRDVEKLAQGGIDRELGLRIADEFSKHGRTQRGVRFANTETWTDTAARDSFRRALRKDIDTVIVTPGIGDRPLWMSSEMGRTIGQFKSFAMASTTRVTMLAAQQKDLAVLNGIYLSAALGMMVYAQKTWQAGKPLSEDPQTWIKEGVDRSGLTGFVMDANNMLEKVNLGINRVTGGPTASRYASRNLLGTFVGPTAGFVGSVGPVLRAAASGEATRSDVKALRRLIPYQNLFYLSHLFDAAEDGVNRELGIPQRRRSN